MAYTQPVKVGDNVIESIINIGEKGDGVAKKDNFVIIVPKGELNKRYNLRIKKVFEKYAIADIITEVR